MSNEVMKQTPVHEIAEQEGAIFAQVDGWWIVEAFAGEAETLTRAPLQLGLADCSARAKVLIQGAKAADVLERAWGLTGLAVQHGVKVESGAVYRLRHDQYFLSGPPAAHQTLVSVTEGAVRSEDGLITVTDATHGRAELWVLGPVATDLLSRLCGLDLHPQAFPNLTARQTSVAKTTQLVIRRDRGATPVFVLVGARSLGAYLWQTIVEAAHDQPLQLLGQRRLQGLQEEGRHATS